MRMMMRISPSDMALSPVVKLLCLQLSAYAITLSHRTRFVPQSGKQHRKSRALVFIASTNPQFTADPFDKRPNNPHSQSFAGGWIESFRQTRAIIGNRQRVALFRIGFQADRNPACAVFGCVRDQFVGDEAERNSGDGRQLISMPSTTMIRSGCSEGQHHGEIATKILEVLLERKGLCAIQ